MEILNKNKVKVTPNVARIVSMIEEHIPPERRKLFRLNSGFRPSDTIGFHKVDLAVDVACDTLHFMLELYEALKAAGWPGGIAIAGPGLPLHLHADLRNEYTGDVRFPHGYPACYFLEVKTPTATVYPVMQIDPVAYAKHFAAVKEAYR